MTFQQLKDMVKALDDGRSVSVGFHLHDGLRNIQDNFGWGNFSKFLEEIERAEEPIIKNYNPPTLI